MQINPPKNANKVICIFLTSMLIRINIFAIKMFFSQELAYAGILARVDSLASERRGLDFVTLSPEEEEERQRIKEATTVQVL